MANEITFTSKLSATIAGIAVGAASSSKTQSASATAAVVVHGTQLVGNEDYEDVELGDILTSANNTSMSYLVQIWNRDDEAKIQVRILPSAWSVNGNVTNVGDSFEVLAGEPFGPVRVPQMASGYPKLQLKSNVANTQVEVVATEAGDP